MNNRRDDEVDSLDVDDETTFEVDLTDELGWRRRVDDDLVAEDSGDGPRSCDVTLVIGFGPISVDEPGPVGYVVIVTDELGPVAVDTDEDRVSGRIAASREARFGVRRPPSPERTID
jgi:hypothetical protein